VFFSSLSLLVYEMVAPPLNLSIGQVGLPEQSLMTQENPLL